MRDTEKPNWTNKSHTAGQDTLGANCTFTATLNLPAAKKGIADEVRQAAVQVDRGQAALKALPGNHQLGEVLVHVGSQTSNEQITWRNRRC